MRIRYRPARSQWRIALLKWWATHVCGLVEVTTPRAPVLLFAPTEAAGADFLVAVSSDALRTLHIEAEAELRQMEARVQHSIGRGHAERTH